MNIFEKVQAARAALQNVERTIQEARALLDAKLAEIETAQILAGEILGTKDPFMHEIAKRVADSCSVEVHQLYLMHRGTRKVAEARMLAMWILAQVIDMGRITDLHRQIALHFNRDRTTVPHAVSQIEHLIGVYPRMAEKAKTLLIEARKLAAEACCRGEGSAEPNGRAASTSLSSTQVEERAGERRLKC